MEKDEHADEYTQVTSAKFKEWDEANKRLKQQPPKDGRVFLKHAKNILPLFESIAELNPIAKAVVYSFKAVISFENDRVENDLRVRSMLLAQTDMMRAVLQVSMLISEGGDEGHMVDSSEALAEILERIRDDIKQSGNMLDAYHKESKLVRFMKALEWKEEITQITDSFIKHRDDLQTFLAIRTARTVDGLHAKLTVLINQAFTPRQDWEKHLRAKLKEYGPKENWINDKAKVQTLLEISGDPAAKELFPGEDESQADIQSAEKRYDAFVVTLKRQLETSLAELLDRNMDLFERKLNFHTQELKEAIANSADLIVRQLGGPYDRLMHDDLKRLWKEMSWIFCVEDRLFTISLYEYYLDYFNSKFTSPRIGSQEEPRELTPAEISSRQQDRWTLEYLSQSSDSINEAVDSDRSGFIRISEVNAFTSQIPSGWTLPQWCAYVAIGWQYEQHIYQKRLQVLMDRLFEIQPEVSPSNLYNLRLYVQDFFLPFALSRQSELFDFSHLPEGFRHQIHSKITTQDERMRGLWKDFKYTLGDRSTVSMLYHGKSFDSYVLQLCMILLEHVLDVAHICQDQTIDLRDWMAIDEAYNGLVSLAKSHLEDVTEKLTSRSDGSIAEALKEYHGGLWFVYYQEELSKGQVKWTREETLARITCDDFSLDDFPVPEPSSETTGVLIHPTWEQYLEEQGLDPEGDHEIPSVWGVSEEEADSYPSRELVEFPGPHLSQICNICQEYPIQGFVYRCIDCDDFDLCSSCFDTPVEDLNRSKVGKHTQAHAVTKAALDVTLPYNEWLSALASFGRDSFVDSVREQAAGDNTYAPACNKCDKEITSDTIFICLDLDCMANDMWLCAECEGAQTESEEGDEDEGDEGEGDEDEDDEGKGGEDEDDDCELHESWHSRLVLPREAIELHQTADEPEHADHQSLSAPRPEGQEVLERVGGVEARLVGLETRMAGLEQRFEEMMNLLVQRLG